MTNDSVDPSAFARSMEFLSEAASDADVSNRLEALAREARIFAVFRDVFPEEFARLDTAALRRRGETRAGVLEFAELVSDRLFPLFVDAIEECGPGGIPYVTFVDHENDWDQPWDLQSAHVLGLYLIGETPDIRRAILEALDMTEADIARVPEPAAVERLDCSFDSAFAREPRALRRLASIALIPLRETGIVFYDGCCMCGGCDAVEWSAENVRALAEHHRDACELADSVRTLSEWLDCDRGRRVAQAVRAWNRALLRERSRNAKPEALAA